MTLLASDFRWPEPFSAAFAVCNDIDGTDLPRYRLLRDFFQTTRSTEFGPGLGWPMGNAVFAVNGAPETDPAVSLWDAGGRPTEAFGELAEDLAAGRLTINHAWGNFNERGGFRREMAERMVVLLQEMRVSLPVWSNHGDRFNTQNMGIVNPAAAGDDPDAEVYHLDLVRRAGARFFWMGDIVALPFQGRPATLLQRIRPLGASRREGGRWLVLPVAAAVALLPGGKLRDVCRRVLHKTGFDYHTPASPVRRHTFRDGSTGWVFCRYGNWSQATADRIHAMLAPGRVDELVATGGAMIFYTHLGQGRLGREDLDALRRLDGLYRRGILWIAKIEDILDHILRAMPEELSRPPGAGVGNRG
ncbi:MAG: hypothetical protein V1809_03985 [Planctomycetota bacterium]